MRWGHWGKGRGGGPREWRRKKDWIDSQVSTVRRTLSRTSSLHLGPYSMCPCAQLLPAPVLVRNEVSRVEQLPERARERRLQHALLRVDQHRARAERGDLRADGKLQGSLTAPRQSRRPVSVSRGDARD